MKEIYCDESRPETIYSANSKDGFMVIGGVWVEGSERKRVKNKLDFLKKKHHINNEFKWNTVSPSRLEFYQELVKYFFENKNIRFRCIVVESQYVDMEKYHQNDNELGFYKFYYQVLNKWCEWGDDYRIYLDQKQNKLGNRLYTLKQILNKSSFANIESVLAIDSYESVFIQLADFLIGAVSYVYNDYQTMDNASRTKIEIIQVIEEYLDRSIDQPTSSNERKFNVFKIRLR